MVSEGVDVPRLRVGVYATTARTELFFRQVVGRFIRRTAAPRRQMSHLFLPSDPRLKVLASEIEEQRDHALAVEAAADGEAVERARTGPGEAFRALSSYARRDDDVLQTTQPGDALQLFGEPGPAPAAGAAFAIPSAVASVAAGETAFERRERLRTERRNLVSTLARRGGEPHRDINARINRATGARSVTAATADQLEAGNRLLETELRRSR
jgi:hypothetical protein